MRSVAPGPWTWTVNPEETALAVASVMTGVAIIVVSPPSELVRLLPHWELLMWAASMIIGGVGVVVGMLVRGYRTETASLALVAGTFLAYAVSIIGVNGAHSVVSVMPLLVIPLAFAQRIHLITTAQKFQKKVKQASR